MRATRYGHMPAQADGSPVEDYARKPGDDLSRLPNLTLSRGTAYPGLRREGRGTPEKDRHWPDARSTFDRKLVL
jgi:hypothetical protein